MKLTVATLIAAVMAVAASSAANAAAVTLTTSTGPIGGAQVETFDELGLGVPAANQSLAGIGGATLNVTGSHVPEIVNGSSSGNYAAPFPVSGVDTTNYLSVFGGGKATITLAKSANYLGLLWGSVDTYNTIQFLDGADNVLTTFTGNDFAVNNGNQGLAGTFYANFFSNVPFLKVVLTSSANSFEVDNIAISSVPLPAALPLFGAALAGMGAIGRKRRKAQAAA
jgi:hypothetical protein